MGAEIKMTTKTIRVIYGDGSHKDFDEVMWQIHGKHIEKMKNVKIAPPPPPPATSPDYQT